jgi:hypothetical protein
MSLIELLIAIVVEEASNKIQEVLDLLPTEEELEKEENKK